MKRCILLIVLSLLACASTGMQKKENEAPIIIQIKASKEKIYQTTSSKLSEYGFKIIAAEPTLGLITTDYADLKMGFGTSVMAGMFGIENLKISITTTINVDSTGASSLILRGIGQYSTHDNIFTKSTTTQPVRKGTPTYKNLIKLSEEIKTEAEK